MKKTSGSGGDTTTTSTVGMSPVEWPRWDDFCVWKIYILYQTISFIQLQKIVFKANHGIGSRLGPHSKLRVNFVFFLVGCYEKMQKIKYHFKTYHGFFRALLPKKNMTEMDTPHFWPWSKKTFKTNRMKLTPGGGPACSLAVCFGTPKALWYLCLRGGAWQVWNTTRRSSHYRLDVPGPSSQCSK